MNLNKVFILGRLTAAPPLRTTPNGQPVTTMSVATNRRWTQKDGQKQEEVEFHNVVLWGKLAQTASAYLTKGSLVLVEGRLATRHWTDKDGNDRRTTEIIAETIQLPPKSGDKAAPPEKKDLAEEEKLPALDENEDRVIDLDDDEEDTGRDLETPF